jgi:leucyl aminopeptidase
MQIKIQKQIKKEKGLLLVPFFKEYFTDVPVEFPKEIKAFVKKFKKEKEFKAKKGEHTLYTIDSKSLPEKILFLGCGERDKFDARTARELGAEMCKQTKAHNSTKIILLLTPELTIYAKELIEGIGLKDYSISKYKTGEDQKKEEKKSIEMILLITGKEKTIKDQAKKGLIIAQATNIVKDLVNGPANIVDADYFERLAKQLSKDYGCKLIVLNKQKLQRQGWGGLLSINQGAVKPAKCLILEHKAGGSKKPIVLVGKGVIFDTGGYNLKPTRHIEDMHQDKAGASVVMGIFSSLKELKIKQNVIGIIPLTENMIDGKAVRPSDIVTMLNKQTVEILNTDAEGRMILADGLHYGKKYKPEHMISVATLTGAAMVALGDRYSAVLGTNKELNKKLEQHGEDQDDLIWELPIHKDHKEKMKSKVADLRNADEGTSYLAGASKAAAFLENFVGKESWAHLDIAGTAYTRDPKKYEQKGGTGSSVRALLDYLSAL